MKILIIEDDEDKLLQMTTLLSEALVAEVVVARSFAEGLRALASNQKYDVLLLDMSMPNFNISSREPTGGVPESFAGRDFLAQMKLRSISTPTIVVTMFDSFGDENSRVSIEALTDQLRKEYSPPFVDLVYYNSRKEGWRAALRGAIEKITNTNGT
jgi:CheY-like chemotaxis protein